MTDLLAIGASGLRAYRTALAATGDNITNAQTVGYARRSASLAETSVTGGPNILYRNRERFDGVDVTGIVRASDAFRTGDARAAATAHGRAGATATWLQVGETALGDDDNGVGAALGRLFAAGDALAADPFSRQPRAAFLGAVEDVASAVRGAADGLSRTADGIAQAGRAAADSVNGNLDALGELNLAIRHAAPGTSTFVELSDQRDRLIDGITTLLDVTVAVAADGSSVLTSGTQTLVANGVVQPLALSVAADGRLSLTVGGAPLAPEGGALAGLVESADAIATRRSDLDTLAAGLASSLNAWHAGGRTPAGAAGGDLLAIGGGAAGLNAVMSDPAQVAAAGPGGATNDNALALAALRTTGGSEAAWTALAGAMTQAAAAARVRETVTQAWNDTASAARDAVEGVDLDREAADLLRFQQAYEASARVIQAAKDTLDAIFRLF